MGENLLEFQCLIDAVPSRQRESLRKRFSWAVRNGWTNIGLWTGEEEPDESDLVGVCEGKFGFVPIDVG